MSDNPFTQVIAEEIEATIAGYRPSTAPGSDELTRNPWPHVAASLLAAPYPPACPDCPGAGPVIGDVHGPDCTHPNAPTLGTLLAIGATVFDDRFHVRIPDDWHFAEHRVEAFDVGVDSTLAALRSVEDE